MHETIESSGRSHVGMVRTQNEDSFLERPDIGLWAVADGMGGHQAGDVASAIVIACLQKVRPPESASAMLRECSDLIVEANAAIRAAAAERDLQMIGTTVAILLASGPYYACLWCGDSRIYRIRDGQIQQLTHDHSEAQEMIDRGLLTADDAKTWSRRNVITRAVGVFPEVALDLEHGEIEASDVFVLCSDGLTAHVLDGEIAQHASEGSVGEISERLIQTTLERGAQDNVTVITVRFGPGETTVVMPGSEAVTQRAPS